MASYVHVNQNNNSSNSTRETQSTVEDLHLDKVVASHPEIGPTPPDGGYGWLILISCLIYHISVPSLSVSYGIVLLYENNLSEYEEGSFFMLWDEKIILVPIFFTVFKLLLDPWCRAVVNLFHMPRIMALSGICLTTAGIILSSFATYSEDDNQIIINIFAGMFAGIGSSLTGQQAEVILKHYFKEKLDFIQTLYKLAPSIGYCIFPLIVTMLCLRYGSETAVIIYGAILLQNCLFLSSFSRPIYIVKHSSRKYNVLRDAVEDEDEEIFSCENRNQPVDNTNDIARAHSSNNGNSTLKFGPISFPDSDEQVIAQFNTEATVREVIDPSMPEERSPNAGVANVNRFSSDFTTMVGGSAPSLEREFQDLNEIQTFEQPQPLYRETTVTNEANNNFTFSFDQNMTEGTARRTVHIHRNFISIISMFIDIDFYLYTLLNLNMIFSLLVFGILFPPFFSQQQPEMDTWHVTIIVTVTYIAALSITMMCVWLPKSINKSARLCTTFCIIGAIGFYGIAETSNRSFLTIWGLLASFASSTMYILQQPVYDDMASEFDAMATTVASNVITATFVCLITLTFDYEYKTLFQLTSLIQTVTGSMFLLSKVIRKFYCRR